MGRVWMAVVVGVAALGVFALLRRGDRQRGSIAPALAPATRATDSTAALTKLPPLTYIDVIRSANSAVPATQPLGVSVDLVDAAQVIVRDPIYLDPLGHLWIARPDAPPTSEALRAPLNPPEHVIRDVPVFAHWWISDGEWSAAIVTRKGSAGACQVVTLRDRSTLAVDRPYQWDRAFSWDGKIVVPTDVGVSIIEIAPAVREHYHALPKAVTLNDGGAAPVAILDARGVLAWAPWEGGRTGSRGVARFVDGSWSDLAGDGWAGRTVHLIPLLDGSILRLSADEQDRVSLVITPLESTGIDQVRVQELVEQLSDPDQEKREAAFKELSRYGPGLWPLLEKLADDQPAEGRMAIRALLRGQIAPALGGMTIIENRLRVVNRQADGVVLCYAPVGVRIPHGDRDPETIAPAWISIRAGGRVDRPLPASLIANQRPEASRLRALRDDWVVCDDAGVRRFIGNGFVPMVHAHESEFTQLIGVDRRGRWIFQRGRISSTTAPASAPSTNPAIAGGGGDSLIIDPTILDPTPRLPVWTMISRNGLAGWDLDDSPVINRGGAWALRADAWEALPKGAKIFTDRPPPPAVQEMARQSPTTTAATAPATTRVVLDVASLGPLLHSGSDGTRFFDGRSQLIVVERDDRVKRWPLPAAAVGRMDPTLVRTSDGRLFLFNEPGRVLRIKPTPLAAEPFALEATFTKDIPNTSQPARIWLDPLGRINMVYEGNRLAVMFPSGHVPSGISQMMIDGQ